MSYLLKLSEFFTKYDNLNFPKNIKIEAKKSLIDYISSLLWGTHSNLYVLLRNYVSLTPQGKSSVIGNLKSTSSSEAAFINGIVSHAMEIDDIHLGTTGLHPGVTIIPSAISVAEELNSSGDDLLNSIIVGYEIAGRIGKSLTPHHRYRGFHATGTIGGFGAAAAVAYLKKFDANQMANSLAIAATQAGGTFAFLSGGVGAKYLHAGNSARNGVLSSTLTELGIDAPLLTLEHPEGFAKAYANESNLNLIIEDLGNKYEIMNVFRKRYFVCGHIFPSIDALYNSNFKHLKITDIKNIKVFTYKAASVLNELKPKNYEEAKFSIPYCLSSLILFGEIKDVFTNLYQLTEIKDFSKKIEVVLDENYTNEFPKLRKTKVLIELENSKDLVGEISIPKGMPDNPYAIEDIYDKFLDIANTIYDKELAKSILEKVMEIEKLHNVSDLIKQVHHFNWRG